MAADNNPINFVLETLQKTGSSLDDRYYSGETFDTQLGNGFGYFLEDKVTRERFESAGCQNKKAAKRAAFLKCWQSLSKTEKAVAGDVVYQKVTRQLPSLTASLHTEERPANRWAEQASKISAELQQLQQQLAGATDPTERAVASAAAQAIAAASGLHISLAALDFAMQQNCAAEAEGGSGPSKRQKAAPSDAAAAAPGALGHVVACGGPGSSSGEAVSEAISRSV